MQSQYRVFADDLQMNQINHQKPNDDFDEETLFIGQSSAKQSFEFGLEAKMQGYNIYICEESSHFDEHEVVKFVERQAKKESVPDDWCYVYNFDDETKPIALNFPHGKGLQFKKDINKFVAEVIDEVDNCLESIEYKETITSLKDRYYDEGEKLIVYIKEKAKALNFYTQISDNSIYFIPVIDNKKISEKTYDELTVETQEEILANLNMIEKESEEIMEDVKRIKLDAEEKTKDYEGMTIKKIVDMLAKEMLEQYKNSEKVSDYIEKFCNNISKQIIEIITKFEIKESYGEYIRTGIKDELNDKYYVNVIVDNAELQHAPVIYANNPNYNNIAGRIEYSSELGNYVTDFTKIRAGLIHQANGGYLILNIKEVLSNNFVWDIIKEVLTNRKIDLESVRERIGTVSIKSISPEGIPISIKIILIGDYSIYQLLFEHDDKFNKFFKIQVQLDYEIPRNEENMNQYLQIIYKIIKKYNVYPITENGKQLLFKYASKLAGGKNVLTTKLHLIEDLIKEAHYWAQKQGDKTLASLYIQKAIQEKEKRTSLIKEKAYRLLVDQRIKLELNGSKVGQINAIVVSSYGDCHYGKPTRVTATSYLGKLGIVNIEKEAGFGGNIYNKGIQVIAGYLGEQFAQDFPLCLNAHLCIEQNYSDIDGDSASCAELMALLSNLSEIGINQGIAATGSIDQKGNIQPVGGIIEKIEGFFDCCKLIGFTGKQGVIIPKQNLRDLVIKDEVIQEIKLNRFHIYAVTTVDEAIEVATGTPMSIIKETVATQLKKYAAQAEV